MIALIILLVIMHMVRLDLKVLMIKQIRILNQSISYNIAYPKDITSQIQKNYFDYMAFISEFIRDELGNPLSLVHYCDMFSLKEAGAAHDPEVDAVNLANLYDAFFDNIELVSEQYKMHLNKHNSSLPIPIAKVISRLTSGETVSPEEFDQYIKEYLE